MAQLVDLVIDRRVFFDIGVGRRHVGFRLIVVVVADEIAHGVFRKQLAKLVVQLCRQRFVGRNHERGLVDPRNNVSHRESFPRAGHAEQHLVATLLLEPCDELFDSLGLIPLGFELGH